MAGNNRRAAHDIDELARRLAAEPYRYGFNALLRLIECLYPDRPRLGESQKPVEDPIRIGQAPAAPFDPASLTEFKPATQERPHHLAVRCFGSWGPNGPLPLHLTEYAQKRMDQHNDPTLVRFLDIFHHRMLSLFYRAWANNEPTVSFDRPQADRFSGYVGAFAGIGMASLRRRDEIADLSKLHYSGRLSAQTKSAEGLQDILNDYFQMPVRILSFVGEWLTIPYRHVCRLGRDSSNGTLGRTTVLGLRVWGCQHKFRIIVGPLGMDAFESFLPAGNRIKRLVAMVRNYIGDELAWDLQLVMLRDEVPAVRLSGRCRLGWTTWLGERKTADHADDLILDAFAAANHHS